MPFGPESYPVPPFTIDELIERLRRARDLLGGDAPVLMVNDEPVCEFVARPEEQRDGYSVGPCVYLSDRCKGIDDWPKAT